MKEANCLLKEVRNKFKAEGYQPVITTPTIIYDLPCSLVYRGNNGTKLIFEIPLVHPDNNMKIFSSSWKPNIID